MANVHRLRHQDKYGERRLAVDSAIVIEVGDLIWLNTDDARPASSYTYASSLLITQQGFRDVFLGVAMESSASGETADITVYCKGVFEFLCAAATFEVGDRLGPDDNASGNALLDQQVIAVSNDDATIARVAKRYASNTTSVVAEIFAFHTRADAV